MVMENIAFFASSQAQSCVWQVCFQMSFTCFPSSACAGCCNHSADMNFVSVLQVFLGTPLIWRTVIKHSDKTSSRPRRPRPSCSWCGRLCRTSLSSSLRSLPSSPWASPFTTHQVETAKVSVFLALINTQLIEVIKMQNVV